MTDTNSKALKQLSREESVAFADGVLLAHVCTVERGAPDRGVVRCSCGGVFPFFGIEESAVIDHLCNAVSAAARASGFILSSARRDSASADTPLEGAREVGAGYVGPEDVAAHPAHALVFTDPAEVDFVRRLLSMHTDTEQDDGSVGMAERILERGPAAPDMDPLLIEVREVLREAHYTVCNSYNPDVDETAYSKALRMVNDRMGVSWDEVMS